LVNLSSLKIDTAFRWLPEEEIERLFKLVKTGELKPIKLKEELDSWGLFEYYQDRFFNLFKKK